MTQTEFVKSLNAALYMETKEVRDAFVGFILHRRRAVHELRQLVTTWENLLPIAKRLVEDRYHHHPGRWKGAAEWIDKGNWQYKTPKVLTYPDFYPTVEQMGHIGTAFIHVEDVRRQLRAAYEKGKADATVYATATGSALPVSKEERMEEWKVLNQALENREQWQERIKELEGLLEHVTRERDKLTLQAAARGPLFADVTT